MSTNHLFNDAEASYAINFSEKGYEFSFVMFDLGEPMHVHVRQGRKQAKYWIEPLAVAWMRGYCQQELNEIERLIRDYEDLINYIASQVQPLAEYHHFLLIIPQLVRRLGVNSHTEHQRRTSAGADQG